MMILFFLLTKLLDRLLGPEDDGNPFIASYNALDNRDRPW